MQQIRKSTGKSFSALHGNQSDAIVIPKFKITDLAPSSGQNG